MLGDMNATLTPNEHLSGSSFMSRDMNEFRDSINNIEMEDVASSRLFYSWTKNLLNVKTGNTSGVLIKLDKIMGNETFIAKFGQVHDILLPYFIFGHCPAALIFPKAIQAKKRAFKFSKFVADKEEFLPLVKLLWVDDEMSFYMQICPDYEADIQEKEQKESQKQTNPSTEWKGQIPAGSIVPAASSSIVVPAVRHI
ncbi:hypothetical protein Tco_0753314 [Tanacetum coccineum]